MSLPYHRGHASSSTSGMYRNNANGSGSGGAYGGKDRANEVSQTLMEMENNQRWSELGEQVRLLKELSQDINSEVKSQNAFLDGMGKTFSQTSELFQNTISKLGVMLSQPGSNHMYYLIGFVVFVFIVLYYLMQRK